MAAFEYKIIPSTTSDEEDETLLNDFGADGWELVGIRTYAADTSYEEGEDDEDADEIEAVEEEYLEEVVVYYLKRQKG